MIVHAFGLEKGETFMIYGCIAWRVLNRLSLHLELKLARGHGRSGGLSDWEEWLCCRPRK